MPPGKRGRGRGSSAASYGSNFGRGQPAATSLLGKRGRTIDEQDTVATG